ncbi:hypothetical protein PN466_04140 [Roseofilum reptotaenium CS-1145]|uniref:Uncharacterized protein n=1 Tax=Roseofilum reptotaenium AO1-A TaxID=1925591 RepID=A0A1L9QXI2_9CYAN|nr:hypothetical protein [Roseofilum reptotaenium]MDB9516149.1 hypothetical protein [Roseofilum reptotaenium CS-1145]OJJ27374.1 hypothetical protein BI308_02535 [Roseofilum reptotaenium AO1-A]
MAQVLVPVYIGTVSDSDDGQYYKYFEESEVPGLNRFNIGDKVRFCDDFVLVSHKSEEHFTADVEHTHLIELIDYCPDKKEYSYWVKIDPMLRHCGEAFSF